MMMMAFSILALAAASGAAIDFARGLNFKLALQSAADAAALAGATEYLNTGSQTNAKSLATAYITNAQERAAAERHRDDQRHRERVGHHLYRRRHGERRRSPRAFSG